MNNPLGSPQSNLPQPSGCVHNNDPCDNPIATAREAARHVASRGRRELLGTLSHAQQNAASANLSLNTIFTAHAVQNQTFEQLLKKYGDDVFQYNAGPGPDFTYLPTGEKIELTTPKQVDVHKARPYP